MKLCMSCEYAGQGGKHCLGTWEGCQCECTKHTLGEDDIRLKLIAVMTAEAHEDFALLKEVIGGLTEEEAKACLLISTKYAMWMARTAGIDPVQMVQSTALFWQGGEPEDDESTD